MQNPNDDQQELLDQATHGPFQKAVIRTDECIGCTKCLPHCPVDAIVGSAKQLHVVISDECTGCERCIAPCPVDCIDMVPLPTPTATEKTARIALTKTRYQQHHQRLARQKQAREKLPETDEATRRNFVAEAIARAQKRRQSLRENPDES